MYVECHFCNKQFLKKHIDEHLRIHTDEKPFVCEICQEAFASKPNLDKHLNKYHIGNHYTCKLCDRVFISRTLLTKHENNIKNPLTHQCKRCCQSFSKKGNLDNHIKEVHSMPANANNPVRPVTDRETRNPNEVQDMESTSRLKSSTPQQSPSYVNCKGKRMLSSKQANKSKRKLTSEDQDIIITQKKLHVETHSSSEFLNSDESNNEISGTQSSIPSENVNLTNNPLNMDKPSHVELPDNFILASWRLSETAKSFEDFCHTQNSAIEKNDVMINVLQFLRGNKISWSFESVLDILQSSVTKKTGSFITALMLTEGATQFTIEYVIKLYDKRNDMPEYLQKFIEDLCLYILQRHLNSVSLTDELLDSIPKQLWNRLTVNYNDFNATFTNTLLPCDVDNIAFLSIDLLHLIYMDLEPKNGTMILDKHSNIYNTERLRLWSILAAKYVHQLPYKKVVAPFHFIMTDDIDTKQRTRHYFDVKCESCIKQVYLHEAIVQRFVTFKPQEQEQQQQQHKNQEETIHSQLSVNDADVKVFTSLLYLHHEEFDLKGKITTGVYHLANRIGIDNVWNFLFREYSCMQFTEENNKKDMLQIMIMENQQELLDQIAETFTTWIPVQHRTNCLNRLPADKVISFLSRSCLNLDEIEVYQILIQWSFGEARKTCTNELNASFDPDVYANFKLVRGVLRLVALQPYFPLLRPQKYISLQDIKEASYYASILFHTPKPPCSSWFAVDIRTRKRKCLEPTPVND